MNCGFPHHRNNYDKINDRFKDIVAAMAALDKEDKTNEG